MKTLDDAIELICQLKGMCMAQDTVMAALIRVLPPTDLQRLASELSAEQEAARTMLLGAQVSEHTIDAFERDALTWSTRVAHLLD